MNSVSSQNFHSIWRHIYGLGLIGIILSIIGYAGTYGANIWIDHLSKQQSAKLQQVQERVAELGAERTFFSYEFAQEVTNTESIKRSEHIQMLIEVLNQIQNNDYVGAQAIQLSDFTISPTSISLKGKVIDLLLLYYSSSEKNYKSVIDRFTDLPFISNLKIQKYTKIGDYYEFVLTADINLNGTFQSDTGGQDNSSDFTESNSRSTDDIISNDTNTGNNNTDNIIPNNANTDDTSL